MISLFAVTSYNSSSIPQSYTVCIKDSIKVILSDMGHSIQLCMTIRDMHARFFNPMESNSNSRLPSHSRIMSFYYPPAILETVINECPY